MKKYSKYQKAIFSRFKESEDNLIIEAVAGSGKTTTIVDLLKDTSGASVFIAFNKHIATELSNRVPVGTECKTLHSLGYSLLRDRKLDQYKIVNLIQKNYKKIKESDAYNYARVISLLKANGYFSWENSVVENILAEFDIDYFDTTFGSAIWNDMLVDHKTIDFDEMIWLPVFTGKASELCYDTIFIDEAQDLSPIQIMFIRMIKCKRVIAVGDTHQAIYAFRGADKNSMANIKESFNMIEMPLSISYRCKEAIVKEAQKIVPHIEFYSAGGLVSNSKVLHTEPGSMILCRVNAPLVKECLGLIKQGKPAIVRGKDIAEGLIKIIKNNDSIDAWYSKAISQKGISEGKKLLIEDKYDTLKYLWKGSKDKTISSIKSIFSDSTNSNSTIILSTIHKAKGLEAENVYAIRNDLLPHPRSNNLVQEQNLKYVLITRAKESLCFIQ